MPARDAVVADEYVPVVGQLDRNGKLVILYFGGSGYAVLETDYALVFFNEGDEAAPKCRYDLSSRESGHEKFYDLDLLVQRLTRIPKPKVVDFYTTCMAPPWISLPKRDIDGFFQRMKEVGVELRETRPDGSPNSVCTCP
jgi:hypothetical protein